MCVVCTWIHHLDHTGARIAVTPVFRRNAQSNWPSIAHTHSQGAGSEPQGLKATWIKHTQRFFKLTIMLYDCTVTLQIWFCCNSSSLFKYVPWAFSGSSLYHSARRSAWLMVCGAYVFKLIHTSCFCQYCLPCKILLIAHFTGDQTQNHFRLPLMFILTSV